MFEISLTIIQIMMKFILLDDTNLFIPKEYKKNDKIILKCFQ